MLLSFINKKKYNFNFYNNKYVIFFILKYIFKKKKSRKWIVFYSFYLFFFNIFFFLYSSNFYILKNTNNINYFLKLYNVINQKKVFFNFLISSYFSFNNSYFFWYFFNKDKWIQLLINIIMKKGKKFSSYKIIYKAFFFIKKLIGLNPIFFLKKSLYKNRFLFDIQQLKLRKRTIIIPKLLSLKSQLSKSIKYLLNDFSLKSFKILGRNKNFLFFQKISYLFLNNLFNKNRLKKLVLKESLLVKNNFYYINKENFLNKYLSDMEEVFKKQSFFKKKFKSFDKKYKYLKYKRNQLTFFKTKLEEKKMFLFCRFQLNLQSKTKLRSKWF